MSQKTLNTRIQHKHDLEANWLLAKNFIPLQGEIIVYDIDDTHSYERFKIGDGVQNVNDLPFYNDGFVSYNEQNLTDEQKAQARANIDAVANNDMCIIPIENIVDFGGEHTIEIAGDENTFYGGPICTRKINLDYSFAGCPSHIFMSKLPDGCAVQQFWLNFKKPDGSTKLCSFISGVSTTEYFIFSVYPKGKNIVIYTLLANSQTVITYDDNGDYVSSSVNSNIDSNNLINKLNSLLSKSSYVPSADADVTTKKYVDDALALKADQTALDEVSALVGDTAVSEQIDAAIAEIPQTDWNQNDESAPDYVKNRTHYEVNTKNIFGEGTATVITNDYSSDRNLYKTDCVLLVAEYIIGEEYIVNINGEEYIMKLAFQMDMSSGNNHIGFNIDVNESGNILHSPYFISGAAFGLVHEKHEINNPVDGDIVALSLTLYLPQGAELPVTVQVYQSNYELKQLDPKYIKDMYHTEQVTATREITPQGQTYGKIFDLDFVNLLWEHRETAIYETNYYNRGLVTTSFSHDSSISDTVLEFYLNNDWWVGINKSDGTVTMHCPGIDGYTQGFITVNFEDVHQLDEKYIPDSIARVEDVDALHALVGDTSVSEQITTALTASSVLYGEAQTLTKEQKAQARANISKYDWRDITIANTNYTIADYSQSLASNFAEAYAFDIDNALACTGVVSANYSSIATIAHMTATLIAGALNGSSSTVTRLKNIIKEYENLKTQDVISDVLTVCHKGSNDNIGLGYTIAATTTTGYTHDIGIVESVEGYKGRILYNNETNDYTTEYFMYNYNDASLTKQGYIADAKAVGDALVTKVSFTEAQELTEEQKQQARANIDAIANSDIPIKTVELTEIPNKFRVWEYDTGIYYIIPSSTMFAITVKTGTGDDTKEGGVMISGITKLPIFVNKYSNDSVDRWIYWYPSRSGFTSQQLEYSKTDLTWTVNTVEKLPALSGSPDIAGQTIRVNNDGKGYVLSNNVWSVNGQTDDVTITAEDIGAATQEYVSTLVGDTPVAEQINNAIVIATDDEIIEMLTELDMIPVVTDYDGAILADESNNILLW